METEDLGDGAIVGFREYVAGPKDAGGDDDFIFNAWLLCHNTRGDWSWRVPKARYFADQKQLITNILRRARTVVACNPEDPRQILGFAVADDVALHWVARKATYGDLRLGTHLVLRAIGGADVKVATHWTKAGAKLFPHWGLEYDPLFFKGDVFYVRENG